MYFGLGREFKILNIKMKRLLLLLVFLLAFLLRFWQLGVNPPSLDWDEASLGYNAYSILKTAKDEYGSFLPLSIRSFGDFKPPLYTYLTIIPVAIFGLNEFSTRFISAFFGALAIIIAYFLVKELFPQKSFIFYLLSLIFFALSPWHIQFSRVAFEANVALTFFLAGILFFLKGRNSGVFFIFSFFSFIFSTFTYHSERLAAPLMIVGLLFIFQKVSIAKWKFVVTGLLLFILFSLPIISQLTSTAARFGSVTILNPNEKLGTSISAIEFDKKRGDLLGRLMHNRRIVFGREVLAGYLDHFNFDFLFLKGDPPGRHHATGMGMLYFWDLPFVLLGLFEILGGLAEKEKRLIFWWFRIAPVASSFTTGTPHAVRALLYLPTYQIFTAFGVVEVIRWFKEYRKKIIGIALIILTFTFLLLNFYYYLHTYYIHTPQEEAPSWQYGYKEVVTEVSKLEANFAKVIVTYFYDQPYVYFLFYQKVDPSWYQQNWGGGEIQRENRGFGKYEFRRIDWSRDQNLKNVLLIGAAKEIPENASGLIKEIKFPDGSVAFRIVAR